MLAKEKPECSVFGEEHAGYRAGHWPRSPQVLRYQGSGCVHLYLLNANKGLKVTLGIICIQKFQSNQSKPAFLLNFRKSSSSKNMVWTECKGLRGAWSQDVAPGLAWLVSIHGKSLSWFRLPCGSFNLVWDGKSTTSPCIMKIRPCSLSGSAARAISPPLKLLPAPSLDKT